METEKCYWCSTPCWNDATQRIMIAICYPQTDKQVECVTSAIQEG